MSHRFRFILHFNKSKWFLSENTGCSKSLSDLMEFGLTLFWLVVVWLRKKEELSFIFGQIVMSVMSQISISIHSSSMATESKEP